MANAEKCVCCGAVIPEGRQVCSSCKNKELKPCPFCGSKEIAWAIHLDYATIKCPKCRASIKVDGKRYLTLAGAKKHYEPMLEKAWNRRVKDGR